MKPVRDILLARHRPLEGRLDRIRRDVLTEAFPSSARRRSWWVVGWRELILPARTAWTALAALSLLAVGLNLSAPRPGREAIRLPVATASALAEGQRERAQLLAELQGPGPAAGGDPEPVDRPQPPTELRPRNRSALPHQAWAV